MIILLLGPQGSGKGTQGKMLAGKFGFGYISSGDVLRSMAKTRPDIEKMLDSGELLSDEFIMSVFSEYFKGIDAKNIIIDGTPRRIGQYEALKSIFGKIDLAILLKISREESVKRLSARRADPKTGEIYNLVTSPKPPEGVDINSLIQRDDDKPEAINERLDEYHKDTEPLAEILKKDGILVEVDGERSIEEIQEDLVSAVEQKLNGGN